MAEEEVPGKSPHAALIEALEKVEDMADVLIIWECKDGNRMGSVDSNLTVAEALYQVELYKHWLLSHMVGD